MGEVRILRPSASGHTHRIRQVMDFCSAGPFPLGLGTLAGRNNSASILWPCDASSRHSTGPSPPLAMQVASRGLLGFQTAPRF